jgi:putative flippase GtrA
MDPVLRGPRHGALTPPLPVRFALVGLAGAAMYYALLWSMVELGGVPALGASSLAFWVVVTENYLLHRRWTFSSQAPHRQAFPRFALMAGCGAAVNAAVMGACLKLGWHYLLAQALALAAVVSCNVAGTWMIFRGGPEDAAP